jgi:GIY-YIG catalytic domain-containing protein
VKKTKKIEGPLGVPADVATISKQISNFFRQKTEDGFTIGSYYGVYVFYDYDHEPIYVGQTHEGLSGRVSRHMTNQRTDAVAMNVLDPFEVAWLKVFPLHHKMLNAPPKPELRRELDALEYSVFQHVLDNSALRAVLNEKNLVTTSLVELPKSYSARIIPDEMFEHRKHPDIRIARRASTIARLAQVISERDVSAGLRRTLLTQARRLEKLAAERFEPFKNQVPVAEKGEETGEDID